MLRHCIVFHPGGDFILPGRLDEVLSIEGKLRSGPFQCDESCSKFTNCCFSFDSSRMVTNSGNNLIVWNVASGDKIRCLPCKPLSSFSFTASGNFLGTVDSENVFNVYDISNDYTISKCQQLNSESPVEILSMFVQNSWFCLIENIVFSVDENVNVSRFLKTVWDIILPNSLHYCDELICLLHNPQQSWFSKVSKFLNGSFAWAWFEALRYILVGDESVLIYSGSSNAMHIFSIKSLLEEEEQPNNWNGAFITLSRNGDFAYILPILNNIWAEKVTIYNIQSNTKFSKSFQRRSVSDILVVRDGAILYCENRTPELWNNDMTQCLATFDVLVGMNTCFPVSDEVIACVYDSYVTFFNVFTKKIESKTSFSEKVFTVYACSVKYHVLAHMHSGECSLWKNGVKVDGWENVLRANTSLTLFAHAEFSPQGSRLAMFGVTKKVFIFDVVSLRLAQVPIYWPSYDTLRFKFFDDENLVCGSANHILYFINVDRGEIITCLDMGNIPSSIDVSHKRSIVCAGIDGSERFELIKVCLPR